MQYVMQMYHINQQTVMCRYTIDVINYYSLDDVTQYKQIKLYIYVAIPMGM